MYGNIHVVTEKSLLIPQRLLQYAQHLANDKNHNEIAKEMNVQVRSVEAMSLRYRKLLGVNNKTGLVALLLREKLIQTILFLLFFATANAQRVIIDPVLKDTTIIPCACETVIRVYKPPNNVNRPPVAIVTELDMSFTTPKANIILDASCSYDPEGYVLRFFWRKVSGPAMLLTETNKPMAYASNMGVGIYTFEVRVVDAMNTFAAKTIVVQVKSQ